MTGRILETRVMRTVRDDTLIVPKLKDVKKGTKLEYDGVVYRFAKFGGGQGYVIRGNNKYEVHGPSRWATFTTKVNGTTHLVVISEWEGGGAMYTGFLVKKSSVSGHLVPYVRRKRK